MEHNSINQSRIIAPVCTVKQVEEVLNAGADEVYFSLMTSEWIKRYGNADFISRRQSEFSHFTSLEDLKDILKIVADRNKAATLVLNSRYTEKQLPHIFEIITEWEISGGNSVMISDITLLLWLKENNSRLKRHLSVLSGVFNRFSVDFFSRLDVSRIVLPRELTLSEIQKIVMPQGKIEFEVISMFQKCEFIDSFCSFYHAFNFQPFIVKDSCELLKNNELPVITSFDINYEGHACQRNFLNDNSIRIKHLVKNDFCTPYCAACQLLTLNNAGVRNFKIAGRGYPIDLIVMAIKFLRISLDNINSPSSSIKNNYRSIFGGNCSMEFCYYKQD